MILTLAALLHLCRKFGTFTIPMYIFYLHLSLFAKKGQKKVQKKYGSRRRKYLLFSEIIKSWIFNYGLSFESSSPGMWASNDLSVRIISSVHPSLILFKKFPNDKLH